MEKARGWEKWRLLFCYIAILSLEPFQRYGLRIEILAKYAHANTEYLVSMFLICPSIVWTPLNGRRDILDMLFKSYGLTLKTLTAHKVQVLSYGLKYST